MNDKSTIPDIRSLLHKYYAADTTPEEELLLESYFLDTTTEELPDDIADDGRLFSAIAELHPDASEMEVPVDFFEKISEISRIPDIKHKDKTQRNWESRIGYALTAACACLMIAIGIRVMIAPKDIYTKPLRYAAESPRTYPTQALTKTSDKEMRLDEKEESNSSRNQPLKTSKVMTEISADLDKQEDGYIEITDPEEAEKIVIEIGRLLAANSQKTNEAIQHLEKTIEDYKELTKSILQ